MSLEGSVQCKQRQMSTQKPGKNHTPKGLCIRDRVGTSHTELYLLGS